MNRDEIMKMMNAYTYAKVEEIARLFAVGCATEAAKNFPHPLVMEAIETARKYAVGENGGERVGIERARLGGLYTIMFSDSDAPSGWQHAICAALGACDGDDAVGGAAKASHAAMMAAYEVTESAGGDYLASRSREEARQIKELKALQR